MMRGRCEGKSGSEACEYVLLCDFLVILCITMYFLSSSAIPEHKQLSYTAYLCNRNSNSS
jgi:hypothetical protein